MLGCIPCDLACCRRGTARCCSLMLSGFIFHLCKGCAVCALIDWSCKGANASSCLGAWSAIDEDAPPLQFACTCLPL